MYKPEQCNRLVRGVTMLVAFVFATAIAPASAQQSPDPAGVAGLGATQAGPSAVTPPVEGSAAPAGPRLTPAFQEFTPDLPRGNAPENAALAVRGGQHTIVISTLVLVLGIIILVLLIAD